MKYAFCVFIGAHARVHVCVRVCACVRVHVCVRSARAFHLRRAARRRAHLGPARRLEEVRALGRVSCEQLVVGALVSCKFSFLKSSAYTHTH